MSLHYKAKKLQIYSMFFKIIHFFVNCGKNSMAIIKGAVFSHKLAHLEGCIQMSRWLLMMGSLAGRNGPHFSRL